jgi:hypothetical protein
MALSQVGDNSLHHRNSHGTNQRTSVASVSLGTIYDVQWTVEVNDVVLVIGMFKAEKNKPSYKHCQMQGPDFPFGWTLLRQQFFSYRILRFLATKHPLNTA